MQVSNVFNTLVNTNTSMDKFNSINENEDKKFLKILNDLNNNNYEIDDFSTSKNNLNIDKLKSLYEELKNKDNGNKDNIENLIFLVQLTDLIEEVLNNNLITPKINYSKIKEDLYLDEETLNKNLNFSKSKNINEPILYLNNVENYIKSNFNTNQSNTLEGFDSNPKIKKELITSENNNILNQIKEINEKDIDIDEIKYNIKKYIEENLHDLNNNNYKKDNFSTSKNNFNIDKLKSLYEELKNKDNGNKDNIENLIFLVQLTDLIEEVLNNNLIMPKINYSEIKEDLYLDEETLNKNLNLSKSKNINETILYLNNVENYIKSKFNTNQSNTLEGFDSNPKIKKELIASENNNILNQIKEMNTKGIDIDEIKNNIKKDLKEKLQKLFNNNKTIYETLTVIDNQFKSETNFNISNAIKEKSDVINNKNFNNDNDSIIYKIKTDIIEILTSKQSKTDKLNLLKQYVYNKKTEDYFKLINDDLHESFNKQVKLNHTYKDKNIIYNYLNTDKIKNINKDENKVLEDIIQGDKINKNKENLTPNQNLFMSKLNSVKENSMIHKNDDIVINRNNVVKDLIRAVKYMENENIKELTVKINPKELGELAISVTMENGIMKANIAVKNEITYHIINSKLHEFNAQLMEQNTKIQSFSLNLFNGYNFNQNQGNQESFKQQNNYKKLNYKENEEISILEEKDLYDNNLNILA
ncbi:hook-length control protein FliK [Clostridium sp. USBA 49]|uniref:flagellar hook-length control protein FliK n=1 Tax=Clostridium sp. USBA 49 TaxID=1881060 RepID=UPI0009CD4EAF|nr:flagellar hook-length control protein FliK [Clostridium sp. USBA 49]SKA72680.1 hook-length control protein FliK [Clostridium sp. USBA 49]